MSDTHEDLDDVEGKIFIGGLSWQTTEATLRAHFEKFGELTDVALMVDKRTGQPRGFGFIKLKYPQAADIVCAQEHSIDGRKVDVKKAVPRDRAPAPTRNESKKIFVGGLSAEVTDNIFHDYFSKFGPVKDAIVMVDRSTNRSRGFGFVTFENEESIENVIKTENTIMGKWVEVKRAEPRDMKYEQGVGGRGGMGGGMPFRGGMGGGRGMGVDMRMGGMGGRGYGMSGRGMTEDFGYNSMSPYARTGYGGAYPQGYGPAPTPYGMQAGYPTAGYGAYATGYPSQAYAGYPTNPSAQHGYGAMRTAGVGVGQSNSIDGSESPTSTPTAGYGSANNSQGVNPQHLGNYGVNAGGQQYQYPSTMAGYGGAYGLYGQQQQQQATGGAVRTGMTAQEGYEGAYSAYRQQGGGGGASQNRLDRSFKPY